MDATLPLLWAALLLATADAIGTTAAFVLIVPSGKVKCVREDLRTSAMSVGHYITADDNSASGMKISARVMDPNGNMVHFAESVEEGEFAFVAMVPGEYSACFWTPIFQILTTVSVDFQWTTGIAAKTWPAIAKKGVVEYQNLEMELKKLVESVKGINEEMRYLREREEEAWKLNVDTNSKMGMLSLLSLFVCLGVAGLQLWQLNTYLEREKLL